MKIAERCDKLRGDIIALTFDLIGSREPDKETQLAMERLVFEIDRLGNRCEDLCGASKR